MQINFLGDSITEGVGASVRAYTYTHLVSACFGAQENNFGVGGTRIAPRIAPSANPDHDEYFLLRAVKMPRDADFTFVFGGTNDYGHGDAPLGQPGDRDVLTFCSALARLCDYLEENFPKDKLCFILPLHRENEEDVFGELGRKPVAGSTLPQYVAAIVEILKSRNIAWLDLRQLIPVHALKELTDDGLHPNDAGHKLIADALCAYLVQEKKLVKA